MKVQCSSVPPVEVEFIEFPSPPEVNPSDDSASDHSVRADVQSQTVSMKTVKKLERIADIPKIPHPFVECEGTNS